MKRILSIPTYGYPRKMDWLLNLQTEMLTMGNSLFGKIPFDLVLQGCGVTDNGNGTVNIASGIVYIVGQIIRFDGANNIANDGSMIIGLGADIPTDAEDFATGVDGNTITLNAYSEQKGTVIAATTRVGQLKIGTSLYDLPTYISDVTLANQPKGTIWQGYDLDNTLLSNFDANGLGITPRWSGWALDNGNYSPGSVGRVLIAAGTYTDTTTGAQTVFDEGVPGGEIVHQLTTLEMPKHKARISLSSGTAGRPEWQTPDTSTSQGNWPQPGGGTSNNARLSGFSDEIGGDVAHNNMQPYMPVYRAVKII